MKEGLGGQKGHSRVNHDLETFLDKTFNINLVQNDVLNMIKVFWKRLHTYMHWSPTKVTQTSHISNLITHGTHKMTCDPDACL